jgi:hypothetical protein
MFHSGCNREFSKVVENQKSVVPFENMNHLGSLLAEDTETGTTGNIEQENTKWIVVENK